MILRAQDCPPEAPTTRPRRDNVALLWEQQVGLESAANARWSMLGPMRFSVRHQTLYGYSVPVVLAPHLLRLSPRPENQIQTRSLVVWPEPVGLHQELDPYGNRITRAQFSQQPTQELRIESRFELETSPPGLTSEISEPLPWTRPLADDLSVYRSGDAGVDLAVIAFARAVAAEVGQQPVAFLNHLCRTIHARADKQIRTSGHAQAAAETLASWQGACRDLTVLFLAAARSMGMPARFCSGYQSAAETPDGQRYLHAWPEVFLPDVGWRGWDPTHGVVAGEGHVALCAAPDQAGTMPVVGGFYFAGSSVTSTLDFDLRITTA
jgi:transglutaminase-like putative cysteine protease